MNNKISNIANKYISFVENHRKLCTLIIYLFTYIVLFLVYRFSEYRNDDITYSYIYRSQVPLASFHDVVVSQTNHYFQHGGRAVAHTLLQLFILIGKPISCFFYAAAYTALVYIITKLSRDDSPFAIMTIMGFLYFINPCFNDSVTWYTGSANYLWTILLVLIAVYPFIQMYENNPLKRNWILFLLLPIYLLAGWTNENIAPTMLITMLYILSVNYKRYKKIPVAYIVAFLFSCLGCAMLLLAPGNYVRSEGAGENPGGILGIAYRGHGQVNAWLNWLLPAILVLIITYWCMYRKKLHIENSSKLFTLWFIVAILIMIASPIFPQRATFGGFILLLISLMYNLTAIAKADRDYYNLYAILGTVMWIGYIASIFSIALLAIVRGNGVYIPG